MKNKVFTLLSIFILASSFTFAQRKELRKKKQIDKYSKYDSMKMYSGFFNFFYNTENDHIYLEISDLEKEFLYVNSLSEGIGSNDIGLDRGQLGNSRVVYFKKAGNRLLLVEPNQKYRANSENYLEKKSIKQAFAKSVIWSFPIIDTNNNKIIIFLI